MTTTETNNAVIKDKKQKPSLKYLQDKDKEPVRGIFRFHEVPGGAMSFCYKAYKGDHVERYDLIDGQIYTLPLGVAKHLNKNGWYPQYSYVKDEQMQNIQKVTHKVRRFSFQSLEFVDIDDVTPVGGPLSQVELIS